MTNKERYAIWAKLQEDLPVFMQPWWMDAVCAGKAWNVILVYKDPSKADFQQDVVAPSNPIVAAMPYLIREKWRFHFVLMPQETQIGGVWMTKEADPKVVAKEIVRQLGELKLDYYYQHYPLRSPLPELLAKKNYTVRERVTYRIEDTEDMDKVVANFSKNKSRQLAKAEKSGLVVDMSMGIEDFYREHKRSLKELGKEISYSREFLLVLERKASRNKQCSIVAVRTQEGELCAAAFVVWDSHSMYYLVPFYVPKYKDLGAGAMLVKECIALAGKKGLAFDFEGSMNKGVANHYRQFGSTAVKYHSVERHNGLLFRIVLAIQQMKVKRENKL